MTPTKKKILIIVENLPVPFDSRVWKEARALHQHGYEVSVLSPRGKGYRQTHEILEGIHIYRHPMPKEGSRPLGYLWEYGCALFWEFLFSWWIFLTRGFKVIQGCNPPDNIFLVALPFKFFGVKYIFDHHDLNPELYLSKYDRRDLFYRIQVWLERLTFRVSDVVISTNNSYKDIAVRRGRCLPDRVFVVRNGPELETFKAVEPNLSLKHGKRYLVGYVGTMNVQEGLDILIDAADYIRKTGREDVHFTCVGGGPELPKLRRMIAERNLDGMFNFTGRVSDEDLLGILSTADVCVNPDRPGEMNDLSTMIKIMEYMALGKPIVQFDLREGRFSAQDASLYCNNEDQVEDFSAKIIWLLDHPEERKRMGEFGRSRVQEELAWNYSVPNFLSAYECALGKPGTRRPIQTHSCEIVKMKPLVSILIPAYNAEKWIADTVRSALAQTWPHREIIIVDDGSKDGTLAVARQFEAYGVRVVTKKNEGAAATRNTAYQLSKGDWIQWLDADDLLSPDKIARQLEMAETVGNRRLLLSCGWSSFLYRYYRAKFTPTPLWCDLSPAEWLFRKMSQNLYMQTATWLVSRELTEAAGPWNTSLLGDDDGEYFCRVLLASDGVRFVPDARVYYRATGAGCLSHIGDSDRKKVAQWHSMQLHMSYLRGLEDTARTRAACVQYMQNYIVLFYLRRPDLVEKLQEAARILGGSLQTPRLPWKYSWIGFIFGQNHGRRAQIALPRYKQTLLRSLDQLMFRLEDPSFRNR